MIFEIFREKSVALPGLWHWRLMADAAKPIAFGQGYRSRQEAERAIALVRGASSAQARLIVPEKQR
jgi:uncharacterized protein YegP (UPF0339 family)